jgi:hypothetical protein
MIPITYAFLFFASIAIFAFTGRYHLFRRTQLLFSLLLPFLLGLALGGFVSSSAVVLWSLNSVLGALLISSCFFAAATPHPGPTVIGTRACAYLRAERRVRPRGRLEFFDGRFEWRSVKIFS